MKRIICIIVISLLLVAASIMENIYTNTTIDNLLLVGESVVSALEKDEERLEQVKALNEYWNGREKTMCLFINHKDMESIGESLEKAQVYLESKDKQSALNEMKQFNYIVKSFKHISQFNLQNIF